MTFWRTFSITIVSIYIAISIANFSFDKYIWHRITHVVELSLCILILLHLLNFLP